MNGDTLTTGSSSGTQGSTQNPQASTGISNLGTQASSLQTGTASSALSKSTAAGIRLQNNPLSGVTLSTAAASTPDTTARAPHHSINPALLIIAVLLFVVAIGLFVSTTRSAKTTTKYY